MSPRAKAYLPFLGAVLAILSTTAGAGLWVLGEARAMADTGNRKAEAIEAKLAAETNRAAEEARVVKMELLQRQDATDRKIERVEEKVDAILLELRRRR
jgi:hypothetical protein